LTSVTAEETQSFSCKATVVTSGTEQPHGLLIPLKGGDVSLELIIDSFTAASYCYCVGYIGGRENNVSAMRKETYCNSLL